MTRIETEAAEKLGMTVKAAAVVNYPGWFQHEAIKRQFRGPLAGDLAIFGGGCRQAIAGAGQAALAAAGLPELGILAVTDQGVHVLTTKGILRSSPKQEVLFLPAGSYTASTEPGAFTGVLTIQLPSGQNVRYESSSSGLPLPTISAFEVAVEAVAGPLLMSEESA
jgi:hypothetical protein